jgi:uncharacterized protein YecE (DUF72 family)
VGGAHPRLAHGRRARGRLRAPGEPPPAAAERDVYVYFDNDAKVRAPFDALRLAERLGG